MIGILRNRFCEKKSTFIPFITTFSIYVDDCLSLISEDRDTDIDVESIDNNCPGFADDIVLIASFEVLQWS